MKRKRYGKINLRDYTLSFIAIGCFLSFSILSAVLKLSPLFIVFPLVCALVRALTIFLPHREQFVITQDSINLVIGKRIKIIHIPTAITIIVSYSDIRPPLSMRTAYNHQTHILKGKYSISILNEMPSDEVLQRLHKNYVGKYTQSMIQSIFEGHEYLYSFVCDQETLKTLVDARKCTIILPKSLKDVVKIPLDENVIIDCKC